MHLSMFSWLYGHQLHFVHCAIQMWFWTPSRRYAYGIIFRAVWVYTSTSLQTICMWHCFPCGMGLYQHESPNIATSLHVSARCGDECWQIVLAFGFVEMTYYFDFRNARLCRVAERIDYVELLRGHIMLICWVNRLCWLPYLRDYVGLLRRQFLLAFWEDRLCWLVKIIGKFNFPQDQ